ncbi:MAG: D-alanyl-D-alanine carboxypeptidase [Bacilli bacterium]|nr:D-alanyl-D-alanine carboxypeptidase [Bacilli bacterium]
MKKLIICFFIILSMPVCVKADEIPLAESAKSAILLEADTGKVLFEKNADEKLPPASMTKLMSMLIIIEAIDHGVIKWNQNVTVSENASKMGGSQILLETGEKMTVRDLFKGVAIASGNDAVVALSEAVAGNENNFINMMNKKARQLGLKNTNFKNPHGLDTADHYSSSRDMALIAKELVKHKDVLKYTSIYETYLRENTDRKIWLVNTNKLVRFKEGVDGLKTGFTRGAGYCMTATAKQDGMRIIAVVMGQKTSKIRNKEISEMLDYAFAQYKSIDLLKNKKIGLYKVENGKSKYVEVIPKDKAVVVEKKSEKLKNIDYDIKVDTLRAPLKTGDIVGKMYIKMNNKVIKTINLTVSNDVHKANFINLFMRNVKDMIMGNMKLD